MAVKLNSTGGGSVTLDSPSTASNYTVTLPSAAGTLATTTGTGSVFTNPTINGFTGDTSAITIGTTQFVKDASGNVGIGTASPLQALDIGNGNISLSSSGSQKLGIFKSGSAFAFTGPLLYSYDSSGLGIGTGNSPIVFGTNNADRGRIDSSGNWLIGANNSTYATKVMVENNSTSLSSKNFITIQNRGTGGAYTSSYTVGGVLFSAYRDVRNPANIAGVWAVRDSAASGLSSLGNLVFGTSEGTNIDQDGILPTERMRLDSSGNLGLGVTPSASFAGYKTFQIASQGVISSDSTSNGELEINNNAYRAVTTSTLTYINSFAATKYAQYRGEHRWFNAPSGTAGNAITFTQAMTLDANGSWVVGSTSPTGYTNANDMKYDVPGKYQIINHVSGTASGQGYILFGYAGGGIGSITQSGTTAVLYNVTSDQRLKENIVDAPNALSSINAIKVRSFDWKSDGSHSEYGYIAQELLEVAPEAVHVPTDPEEMMGVDFGKLTPRLVKAIQELSAQNNALEARLAKLEAK